jgi:hypothetical protein
MYGAVVLHHHLVLAIDEVPTRDELLACIVDVHVALGTWQACANKDHPKPRLLRALSAGIAKTHGPTEAPYAAMTLRLVRRLRQLGLRH